MCPRCKEPAKIKVEGINLTYEGLTQKIQVRVEVVPEGDYDNELVLIALMGFFTSMVDGALGMGSVRFLPARLLGLAGAGQLRLTQSRELATAGWLPVDPGVVLEES
jgi:hypothetical protein